VSGADLVCDVSKDDGNDRTTADGGDEERGAALGVATDTTYWLDISFVGVREIGRTSRESAKMIGNMQDSKKST
jgi:hypothetical protein